jgi:uncharacterized protein YsxB (DUF464 family)
LIKINCRKDGFTITGHAEYAPPGFDVVCAAISALAQTMIQSVESLTEDKIEYTISDGLTEVKFWNLSEKSKTLLDSFFIGSQMIEEAFPKNVQIDQALKS